MPLFLCVAYLPWLGLSVKCQVKMKSYWSKTLVLMRGGKAEDTENAHREEGHLMMEKETVVMKLKAKECHTHEARRRSWNRFTFKAFKRSQPFDT